MARDLTGSMQTEVAAAAKRPVIFYEGEFESGTLRLCSLPYNVSWDGQTWLGAGNLLDFSQIEESTEVRATGCTVSLAANATIVQLALAQARSGQAGKVWLGAKGDEVIEDDTADAGASDTLTLASGASASDNAYNRMKLRLTSGAGSVQERTISDYDGGTKVATVSPRWRQNYLRNNTMVGAVVGAPGTAPTDWSVGSLGTLTREIVGFGTVTVDGVEVHYIDIKISGTSSLTGTNITFSPANGTGAVAAAQGQTWTGSYYCALVAGSVAGLTSMGLGEVERNAAGSGVQSGVGLAFTPDSSFTRRDYTRTLTHADTAFYQVNFRFTPPSVGTAVDFTLRVGSPMLELAATAGDLIDTAGAAITIPDNTSAYDLINPDGIVADPYLAFEGMLDVPRIQKGDRPVISVAYESRLRDLERPREERITHEEQQRLFPGDKGREYVAEMQDKTLIW